jgi:hypothetical protein
LVQRAKGGASPEVRSKRERVFRMGMKEIGLKDKQKAVRTVPYVAGGRGSGPT